VTILLLLPHLVWAQNNESPFEDSTSAKSLENVIIISQKTVANKKIKVLSSLDSYLESNSSINMIKRGAYAWEPLLNGMATERSVVTIDGMRIFGACTDKMDPVTSYVEITNLKSADIHSGQSGAANGATIAGSINLNRRQSGFGNTGLGGSLFTGFETANLQKIGGVAAQYSTHKFFVDMDVTYRNADNYKSGGGMEILYSGFTKYNLSTIAGWKLNNKQELKASVIYDKATDVGYPALPMDVSLAEALISSVQYDYHYLSSLLHHWETKIYYNTISHRMDDTQRPVVPIRMDMPGWSNTKGFYSKLMGESEHHHFNINLSGHYNISIAEMTMFSNTPGEKDMFMMTWPGVHTGYLGLHLEDDRHINDHWNVVTTLGAGINNNKVSNDFGFESLQIFYKDMKRGKSRLLPSASAKLNFNDEAWNGSLGLAYGERAPSVSEGYGFYLFNSSDKYDYIGNPGMKNEKSLELNFASSFTKKAFSIHTKADYFRVFNYIIGKPNADYLPMTIGAKGIKLYQQLPAADLLNLGITIQYQVMQQLGVTGKGIYRSGKGGDSRLPQIQPLSYGSGFSYQHKKILAELMIEGAMKQNHFSREFGETETPAYTIFNAAASRQFNFNRQKLTMKAGIENIFDRHYTTFSDWNKIPRMGRNLFINILYFI